MRISDWSSDVCSSDLAADVGLVERRVDLVEQAERRRVELEDREHQRHGGHRLLAAREQRNVRHALAGRPRHDRDAGVEQVLAGEFEVGMAAAEQARIDLLHARVDPVEGVLEAAAGLAVDLRIASSSVSSAVVRSASWASRYALR